MSFWQAVIYGFIQGTTEFLPISSSAHLVLLPWLTSWKDPGLAFDVALHWGTLIGVFVYFRSDLAALLKSFVSSFAAPRSVESKLPWQIIVATIPGAVMGYLLEKQAETSFRSPWLIAGTLVTAGLLLYFADRKGEKEKDMSRLAWLSVFVIGVSQGLAVIPGVSRSGITISTALLFGLRREDAVRFSFLLSIPIIFGAGLLKLQFVLANLGRPEIWTAMASSALFGFASIHFLIRFVRTRSFTPFVIYRIVLAAVIVTIYWIRTH